MTGESLFSRMFGDEAEVVLFTWMKSTERDVLQSEKVIVTRESVHLLFVRQLLIIVLFQVNFGFVINSYVVFFAFVHDVKSLVRDF